MTDRAALRPCLIVLMGLAAFVSCRGKNDASSAGDTAAPAGASSATYHNPAAGLRVTYPTTWTKLEHGERDTKALVAFLSPPSEKGERQHLSFDAQALSEDVTLEKLKDATIAEAKAVFPRFELISSEKTTFGGRDAWRTVYTAGTDRGTARIMQVLALSNGKAYSATYTARTEPGFARSLPQANQMIDSAKIE